VTWQPDGPVWRPFGSRRWDYLSGPCTAALPLDWKVAYIKAIVLQAGPLNRWLAYALKAITPLQSHLRSRGSGATGVPTDRASGAATELTRAPAPDLGPTTHMRPTTESFGVTYDGCVIGMLKASTLV
jgi:hypothetical protein